MSDVLSRTRAMAWVRTKDRGAGSNDSELKCSGRHKIKGTGGRLRHVCASEGWHTLDDKLIQIEQAKDASQITGLKLLRGYTHHYRIKVATSKYSYRIGVIIRGSTIWLIRFLPRKKVYRKFP